MNVVKDWEPRFLGTTARGYFKVAIRRHPANETWSWALEWNQSYRLVGFFGQVEPADELIHSFPALEFSTFRQTDSERIRYREEVRLEENEDILFLRFNGTEQA